jgi:hypothetical protein
MGSWKQTLAELARDRLMSLKRQAFLLCGDESQAEDLVQDALVRAFARPLRTPRPGAAEAYVRVIMVNLFVDGTRRRSRWNRAAPLLTGTETIIDPADQVLDRDVMLSALGDLSPRQRACMVLRPKRATAGWCEPDLGAHRPAADPWTAHVQADVDRARSAPQRHLPVAGRGVGAARREHCTARCRACHVTLSRHSPLATW